MTRFAEGPPQSAHPIKPSLSPSVDLSTLVHERDCNVAVVVYGRPFFKFCTPKELDALAARVAAIGDEHSLPLLLTSVLPSTNDDNGDQEMSAEGVVGVCLAAVDETDEGGLVLDASALQAEVELPPALFDLALDWTDGAEGPYLAVFGWSFGRIKGAVNVRVCAEDFDPFVELPAELDGACTLSANYL